MSEKFFDYYSKYAQETPDKVLLRIDENELTYAQFMEKTAVLGSSMKKIGIGANDKVGICMPNSIEWYLVYWSAVRIGAQPVPMDPQSGSFELSKLIPATTSKIMFITDKYRNNDIIAAVSALVPSQIKLDKVVCFAEDSLIPQDSCYTSAEKFMAENGSSECDIYEPDYLHTMSLACTSGSTSKAR